MGLEITVDLEAYPKGTPLGIADLGVVENGGSFVISDDDAARYEATYGISFTDAVKGQKGISAKKAADPKVDDGSSGAENKEGDS